MPWYVLYLLKLSKLVHICITPNKIFFFFFSFFRNKVLWHISLWMHPGSNMDRNTWPWPCVPVMGWTYDFVHNKQNLDEIYLSKLVPRISCQFWVIVIIQMRECTTNIQTATWHRELLSWEDKPVNNKETNGLPTSQTLSNFSNGRNSICVHCKMIYLFSS